jgi:hypothetical protein
MIKKIWHQITSYRKTHPEQSMRETGQVLGVSKDMVHRQENRSMKRSQISETEYWESQGGQNFMKRLIVGAIYTFGIKAGVGAGRIEEFMRYIRLSAHAGISESSIYRMMKEIEASILRYKELQERGLSTRAAAQLEELEVVLGLDETWLDNMLLVCEELSSGYLFLKYQVQNEMPKAGQSQSENQ